MAARMQNNYYVDGNNVRKLNSLPERKVQPERPEETRREPSKRVRENIERNMAFDLKHTIFLVTAVFVTLYSCISLLQVQADIVTRRKNITALEENLTTLTDNNIALSGSINSQVDLDYIYQVATTELGMVYPKSGQVVYYESSNPDYVRQFEDIPEAN